MKTKLYAFMMAAIVAVAFNFVSCNNEKDEPKGPVITSTDPGSNDPSNDPNANAQEITVAQAIEIANALEPKAKTEQYYKVRVTVKRILTDLSKVPGTYKNVNMVVGDETGEIQSYYTNNLGNKGFESAEDVPAVGAKIVLVGQLKLYAGKNSNTPEFENGYILEVIENGSGENPSVDPGEVEDVTVAQAIEIANALEPKGKTTKNYRVTVTLTKVFTASDKVAQYGNINCELKDETGTIASYYMNNVGNVKFTSADQVPPIGSKLVVVGPLKLYAGQDSNTPEFENAWIEEILELGTGETSVDPSQEPQPIEEGNIIENYSIEESSFISKDDQSKITSATVTFADGVATIAGSTSSGNMRLGAPLVTLPAGNYILSASVKAESGEAKARLAYAVAKSDNSGYDYKYDKGPTTLAAGADYVEIQYEFTLAAETEIAPVVSNNGKTGNAVLVNRLVLAKK